MQLWWRGWPALTLCVVLTGALTLVAAACAAPDQSLPEGVQAIVPSRTPAPPDAARLDPYYLQPEQFGLTPPRFERGTLRYAIGTAPINLDPHAAIADPAWQAVLASSYDPLVARRAAPNVDPLAGETLCRLCTSWQVAPDQRTFVFQLRQGVRWHDGSPLTADDVVFSLERAADRNRRFGLATIKLERMQSVRALDAQTVEITTRTPAPDFLHDLEWVMIVPRQLVRQDESLLRGYVVGTGPFVVASWLPDRIVLERNPHYAVPGRPWLDRIEIAVGINRGARQAAFLNGEIDITVARDRPELDLIVRNRPGVGFQGYLSGNANGIAFNVTRPPWQYQPVRQALHLAIDRHALNAQLAFNDGAAVVPPATALQRPYALAADELAQLPGFARGQREEDLRTARRLLAEAGYPAGLRSTLTAWSSPESSAVLGRAILPMASAAGIDFELHLLDAGAATKRLTTGAFDAILRPMGGTAEPTVAYNQFLTGAAENPFGVNDTVLDGLIRAQAVEGDPSVRNDQLRQIQTRLLEQVWVAPLIDFTSFAVWRPGVHNFRNYSLQPQPFPINGTAEVIWVNR